MARTRPPAPDVVVTTRGLVAPPDVGYVERKVRARLAESGDPAPSARVVLTAHEDPARERAASAKAGLDLHDGRTLRAHAAAATMHEAIDALDARLRRRVAVAEHEIGDDRRRLRPDAEGDWQRGQVPTTRPSYFPRPVEEREIVAHKEYSYGPMTVDEAADDLERLDHDFYLFENLETGEDDLIARVPGGYELHEPSASCPLSERAVSMRPSPVRPVPLELDAAREALDLSEEPFLFFLAPRDHRGRVLYRRYDGHYGLILPAGEGTGR
jgi:ribosome-associated translation inhibitor RaiA